jgi:hypothetical protein
VCEYGGQLPPEIHPIFCNTGREMDETLDFVRDMSAHWGVPIVWLERDFETPEGFRIVGHNSAARHGQRTPFDDAIERRRFLPNAVTRFCTTELKVRAATLYMQSLGLERWASVIGYRADEVGRLKRAQKRSESGKDPFYTLAPMVDAGVARHGRRILAAAAIRPSAAEHQWQDTARELRPLLPEVGPHAGRNRAPLPRPDGMVDGARGGGDRQDGEPGDRHVPLAAAGDAHGDRRFRASAGRP